VHSRRQATRSQRVRSCCTISVRDVRRNPEATRWVRGSWEASGTDVSTGKTHVGHTLVRLESRDRARSRFTDECSFVSLDGSTRGLIGLVDGWSENTIAHGALTLPAPGPNPGQMTDGPALTVASRGQLNAVTRVNGAAPRTLRHASSELVSEFERNL
jgi:hypothetical protein